jgi:hypothetical protein
MQKSIPIIYLFIYNQLRERFNCKIVQTSYIQSEMNKRISRLPKSIFNIIIHEMTEYSLVKRVNHKAIAILPNNQIKRLDQLNSSQLW